MRVPFRAILSIWVCKILRTVSRFLHRGGTAMPGRIAMKLCPDLLAYLSWNVKTIAITGTNGKTTCSRMVEEAFSEDHLTYFANRSGANLMSGILTEFVMNCDAFGHMRKHYAVIECDEAAAAKVFGQLKPAVIVVTNLFRDQLDRYGEITHTLENIREGVKQVPHSILCLNADCSLTASLSLDQLPNQIVWFGVNATAEMKATPTALSDAKYCIRCKTEYEYDYHTYAHLGGFHCPQCGYCRTAPDFAITDIVNMDESHSEVLLKIKDDIYPLTINLPANYNVYNAVAAICSSVSYGIPLETSIRALGQFSCGFGRMEHFPLAGGTRMVLVKNPAGCSQAIEYLSGIRADYILVICLNDRGADGTDISWIWDADFEQLVSISDHIQKLFVSGDRADDMRIRLKYAGIPDLKIQVEYSAEKLTDLLSQESLPVYIMPTYTAMLDLRSVIIHRCGGSEFWE